MLKKPQYIALALVAVVVLIIINLPAPALSRFKLALSGFFLPLFGLAGSSQQALHKTGNVILPKNFIAKENDQLRVENDQLKILATQNAELLRENTKLRQLFDWQKQSQRNVKLTRVIGRDPANWWRSITIDAGSNRGLRPNLPVLTPEGLVGRIAVVGANRSQVLLLGDPNLKVGALIQDNEGRESGIVVSTGGPLDNNIVDFQFFTRSSVVKPGANVITSGDGGYFPKGILIGQIIDVRNNNIVLSMEARVKIAANLSSLEEVWVLFP